MCQTQYFQLGTQWGRNQTVSTLMEQLENQGRGDGQSWSAQSEHDAPGMQRGFCRLSPSSLRNTAPTSLDLWDQTPDFVPVSWGPGEAGLSQAWQVVCDRQLCKVTPYPAPHRALLQDLSPALPCMVGHSCQVYKDAHYQVTTDSQATGSKLTLSDLVLISTLTGETEVQRGWAPVHF